ncbi:MAG: hypothetical protein HC912_06630 [Saprospiraceae bacterium]|nr:hypothetical protein [Saprospiraceae bacterium]
MSSFTSLVFGLRAMAKLLANFISRGFNTVEKIVYRYAPPEDNNDTEAYVNAVAKASRINRHMVLIPDANTISKLVRAMVNHENYAQEHHLIDNMDIEQAIQMLELERKATTLTIGLVSVLFALAGMLVGAFIEPKKVER